MYDRKSISCSRFCKKQFQYQQDGTKGPECVLRWRRAAVRVLVYHCHGSNNHASSLAGSRRRAYVKGAAKCPWDSLRRMHERTWNVAEPVMYLYIVQRTMQKRVMIMGPYSVKMRGNSISKYNCTLFHYWVNKYRNVHCILPSTWNGPSMLPACRKHIFGIKYFV